MIVLVVLVAIGLVISNYPTEEKIDDPELIVKGDVVMHTLNPLSASGFLM